jgi:hypothetical protein
VSVKADHVSIENTIPRISISFVAIRFAMEKSCCRMDCRHPSTAIPKNYELVMNILHLAGQFYDHVRCSYGWPGIVITCIFVAAAVRAIMHFCQSASAIRANAERTRVRKRLGL